MLVDGVTGEPEQNAGRWLEVAVGSRSEIRGCFLPSPVLTSPAPVRGGVRSNKLQVTDGHVPVSRDSRQRSHSAYAPMSYRRTPCFHL